jgi:hypothetical protein
MPRVFGISLLLQKENILKNTVEVQPNCAQKYRDSTAQTASGSSRFVPVPSTTQLF